MVVMPLAAMEAKLVLDTVSTRPDESHAMVPPAAVTDTSAQQLDCSGRGGCQGGVPEAGAHLSFASRRRKEA